MDSESPGLPVVSRAATVWEGAGLGGDNPQPVFRPACDDTPVSALPGLSPEVARGIGRGCGRRVLPYRLQDRYDRMRAARKFETITLDNGLLRAVFLPGLGGRMISLFDRVADRELLFSNPVFQPANLALRDAWFAGGIEWNIGRFGHACHTCAPVFAASLPGIRGGDGLRIYDYERQSGLFWQLDFHLPPGSRLIYVFTRVVNPRSAGVPLYWWTNIAVAESPGLRVLAPAEDCVFVSYNDPSGRLGYGQARLPGLPTIGGGDGTYPENLGFTNEFFFQCQGVEMPWEVALDADGEGLLEASTGFLGVRKVFSWGMHAGGRRWQEYLSRPGLSYLEIQAGPAPTQQHTVPLEAGGSVCWSQVFGHLEADPALVHDSDWTVARAGAQEAVGARITARELGAFHQAASGLADSPAAEILHAGSGWGALESARRAKAGLADLPAAFSFPEGSMGPAQQPWRDLLDHGFFPEPGPDAGPGEWMVQDEWMELLEGILAGPGRHSWFALLHLGVMRMEAGDAPGAAAAWEESMRLEPNAWACRNLAVAAAARGDATAALEHHKAAWELASASGVADVSFATEYLAALNGAGRFAEGWSFYQNLPAAHRGSDPVRLEAAKAAYGSGREDAAEEMLEREFATIREGARDLTDLWFGIQTRREAARRGVAADDALAGEVRHTMRPPALIDFRVFE